MSSPARSTLTRVSVAAAASLATIYRRSGLLEAVEVLRGIEGISFVHFDDRDVVRHSLVQRIVKAYERFLEANGGRQLSLRLAEPASAAQEPEAGETPEA